MTSKVFEIVGNGWVRINDVYLQTDSLSTVNTSKSYPTEVYLICTKDKHGTHNHFDFISEEVRDETFKALLDYLTKDFQ